MSIDNDYYNNDFGTPSYKDGTFGPGSPAMDHDKLLIHKLEEHICALTHNLSVWEHEKKNLESQLRLCVGEAEDRLEENKELLKEIELLKIEVEKIHSRYEILDL